METLKEFKERLLEAEKQIVGKPATKPEKPAGYVTPIPTLKDRVWDGLPKK